MSYFVYAIGAEKDLRQPYGKCYIGVTNDVSKRWVGHTRSKYTVARAIDKNEWTFDTNMKVIYSGDEESCYNLEKEYRPYPNMGLNEAVGGNGGYTSYTEERATKISQKLTGKPKSDEHKAAISKSRLENGSAKGSNNGNAKTWTLVSPDGDIIECKGSYGKMCDEHGLLGSSLKHYRGKQVPEVTKGAYGGYRAKSDQSAERRSNTSGWMLK
jgi:hypothetical protein